MRMTKTFSFFSLCLILLSGFPGILSSAAAQQQEKRIALVVGNGAYAKSPLATAANDAGLIAQTLQAAGFDVVGARDLDDLSVLHRHAAVARRAAGAVDDARVVDHEVVHVPILRAAPRSRARSL